MAINVNTVYQTVLSILNKEQRGYLTPSEFNRIATQVQLEVFEQYFDDLNQQLRAPGYQGEYEDRVDNIEEKISIFREFSVAGLSEFDALGNLISPQYFYLPSNVHRIGTIMYKNEQEIQYTTRGEYLHLNMSKLTRPSTKYPLYINEGIATTFDSNGVSLCNDCIKIYIYPDIIKEDVTISYIRKPLPVIWGYILGSQSQYIWDGAAIGGGVAVPPTGSVNFEIDSTEQTEVIMRILMYAGVVIRDPEIVQAAASQVQATEVNQKS